MSQEGVHNFKYWNVAWSSEIGTDRSICVPLTSVQWISWHFPCTTQAVFDPTGADLMTMLNFTKDCYLEIPFYCFFDWIEKVV